MIDKNMNVFDSTVVNAEDTTQATRKVYNKESLLEKYRGNKINCIIIKLVEGKINIIKCDDYNFMCDDIKRLMLNNDIKGPIVHILNFDSEQEKKYFYLDNFCSVFSDDTVILTTAYVSAEEFPEDEWYLDKPKPGLKKIPVNDILERESKLLESVGFININDFVQYEYKEAYIYGNEIGRKIASMCSETD